MANKDIINHFKSSLKRGLSIEEIKQQLFLQNYADYDIDSAMNELGLEKSSKKEVSKKEKVPDQSIEDWDKD